MDGSSDRSRFGEAQALRARREELFRETSFETIQRWTLGTVWALKPERVGNLPALARLWLRNLALGGSGLPDPECALNAAGLCGMVRDLSVPTLVEAYRRGLFTFAHYGPLKWMAPAERCVLFFDEFRLGKTARRLARLGRYRVTFDGDFEGVIKACAGRRRGKWHLTWITPKIMRLYAELYDAGYVHSFEVWNEKDELAGGGYGVAVGGAFFTESLFTRESDASKIGFAALNWHLAQWGYLLNDGKWMNPLLGSVGYCMVPRSKFRSLLDAATVVPGRQGRWEMETELATVAAWTPNPQSGRDPASASQEDETLTTTRTQRKRMLVPFLPALDQSTVGLGEALIAII